MKKITLEEACKIKGIDPERYKGVDDRHRGIAEVWCDGYNTSVEKANKEISELKKKIKEINSMNKHSIPNWRTQELFGGGW